MVYKSHCVINILILLKLRFFGEILHIFSWAFLFVKAEGRVKAERFIAERAFVGICDP